MKKIIFALVILLTCSFSVCKASNDGSPAADAARQFGFYVGHGDGVKAGLMAISAHSLFNYAQSVKAECDGLGGLVDVSVINEEVVVENQEVIVTVVFHCKNEGKQIEKKYTLVWVDGKWKVDFSKEVGNRN